uniref:Uncharacterized protein n=1 Tax=Romanomermis culicivorax TaxID=13658 RepID=A0A915KM67_ROMCU
NTLITQFQLRLTQSCATVERTWKSGHRGPVTAFAFTDDTHFLATGSADSTVKVWDLKAQYCTQTLKECSGCITCVQFSPSFFLSDSLTVEVKQFLFYGDDMGRLFVRHLTSDKVDQQVLNVSHHTSPISAIIFDQKFVYTCARDSTIVKLNGEMSFALEKIIPTFESLESMIFSATDVNFGSADNTDKNKKRAKSTEDVILLSGGESGCLKLWSVSKGTCFKTLKAVEGGPIVQVLHCEALRLYLTVNYDQSFAIVSADSFEIEGMLQYDIRKLSVIFID